MNKIKNYEVETNGTTPFENCKLSREKYADVLTKIVSDYKDGFVLAINNEWGTGKTTFVRMWEKKLISKGFKTLYFNAWENDFDVNLDISLKETPFDRFKQTPAFQLHFLI